MNIHIHKSRHISEKPAVDPEAAPREKTITRAKYRSKDSSVCSGTPVVFRSIWFLLIGLSYIRPKCESDFNNSFPP